MFAQAVDEHMINDDDDVVVVFKQLIDSNVWQHIYVKRVYVCKNFLLTFKCN